MQNKNMQEDDQDFKDIFSGMKNYLKKPLDLEAAIMQKIDSEKDYAYELEVLRKKVRIGQLVLLLLGGLLILMFLWPVFGQSSIGLNEASSFEILPTLYALLVLILSFSYVRIKTQWN